MDVAQGTNIFGEKFANMIGLTQYYTQADYCFFFLNFRKKVALRKFRKQNVVHCDVFQKKSAQI